MKLPVLYDTPRHYSDCCLSLSIKLFDTLGRLVLTCVKSPTPSLVVSIGSGTGLLEALLQSHLEQGGHYEVQTEGIEVLSQLGSVNRYLPEESINIVGGTWVFCDRATAASVMLFVYPRTVKLVAEYVRSFAQRKSEVEMVVWLGPKADWSDFGPCFHVPELCQMEILDDCGLVEYEMLAVARRIHT